MLNPVIEFRDVSLKFNQKTIFDHFNLKIMPHDQVVIFGKSGVGKSTFLKLVLGFDQPDSGQIYIKNKAITASNIHWARTHIAYVDQDVMIGEGKVIDVIREYFNFRANQHLTFNQAKLEQLMAEFELAPSLLTQPIDELSGGERQRVALVMALLLERPIMLLDEVTAALDPATKKLAIAKLTAKPDITLIVVTHDQEWKKIKQVKLFDFKEKQWKQ